MGLTLLTRPDCGLCEEFLVELRALGEQLPLPVITLLDVDSDPQLARRYGLDIQCCSLTGSASAGTGLTAAS